MFARRRFWRRLVPTLALLAVVTAACGGSNGLYGGGATPTRTPASPATAAPPAARPDYPENQTPTPPATIPAPTDTAAPTQPPAAAPTEAPAPTVPPPTVAPPAPTTPPAPGPVALTVVARGIRFEQTELTVDAGAQVTLTFDNQDSVSHNVDIVGVAKTDIFAGPGQATITFTAPSPGTYAYRCDVHPNAMQGTLVVR